MDCGERERETRKINETREKLVGNSFACFVYFACFAFSLLTGKPLNPVSAADLGVIPSQSEERININTASVEELTRLPGIGPSIAAQIVERRRKHGPFKRPQEIIVVRGMSARRYRQISHLIRT
jgi:competence protein ComEA